MNFLAFQEFLLSELKESGNCIWCGQLAPANRAHIISKKLVRNSHNAPTLHFRVCEPCNSKCGELEQWILRKSPLSWIQMMLYAGPSSGRRSVFPSYFFSDILQEWVIFQLDGGSHSYVIPTQLVMKEAQELTLLTQESENKHESIIGDILALLHAKLLKRDIRPSLPVDFSTRILLFKGNAAVIVARTDKQAEQIVKTVQDLKERTQTHIQLGKTGQQQHHFLWSKQNWARFCAKTALESLCLFEGGNKCLAPDFALVRAFVTDGKIASGKELIFNQKSPKDAANIPSEIHVDLSVEQSAPTIVSCVAPHFEVGSHAIVLYENRGWISASVVYAGLPATTLVLAGPDVHVHDFYQMIYDAREETYHFLRLAYDETKPIIPVAVPGRHFTEIAKTYKLRAV